MSEVDQHHGQGGSFVVRNGVRELVRDSQTKPSDTGGARDEKGKPLDAGPGRDAKPEAALPEPQAAPWATQATPAKDAEAAGSPAAATTKAKGA